VSISLGRTNAMSNLAVPAGLRVTSVILLTHATCPHFKWGTTVSVRVVDHLIVSAQDAFSFRKAGLL